MVDAQDLEYERRLSIVETNLGHLTKMYEKLSESKQKNADCISRQTTATNKLIAAAEKLANNQSGGRVLEFLSKRNGLLSLGLITLIIVSLSAMVVAIVSPDSLPAFTAATKSVITK